MTRSKAKLVSMNWTNIPAELVAIIMSYLTFKRIAKCAEINKSMLEHIDSYMRNIKVINDKIPVACVNYVIDKCSMVTNRPRFCGATDFDLCSMRRLLKRWPDQVYLNWGMTSSETMSSFFRCMSLSNFKNIQFLSLKIVDNVAFEKTTMNLHYMDLRELNIDAEGCDLELILVGLNCRCWDVVDLYLRGDVSDLNTLMLYTPSIASKVTIINTNDRFECLPSQQGLRYILNSGINVELYNIIKFCCNPPRLCSVVDSFIGAVQSALFFPLHGTWKVDRLNVDMIEALVQHSIHVHCGVFKGELKRIQHLEAQYPGQLVITSFY